MQEENKYNIKTEIFEGPLDLLLSLVEKRKLFINDISLAKVADDYISYVRSLTDFPIEEASHFILVASTLVLIKSKSLLPNLSLSYEEEQSIDELQNQLKIHQKFKNLSLVVKKRFGKQIIFKKLPSKNKIVVFAPDKKTAKENFLNFFKKILQNFPKIDNLPKALVKKVISLEEAIVGLMDRINQSLKISFREFSKIGKAEKVSVIINFLAILELVKQGIIQVKQETVFSDIDIESNDLQVPRYE